MGLTRKILLFISLLVVALAVTTLAYTTFQADRLARRTILQALDETRGVWDAYQADRYNKLKLGVRALANDPFFKSLVETGDQGTVADTLKERGQDIKADFFLATDPAGVVIARSDRPASSEDLSHDPIVMKPLEGEESTTIWRQGGKLYHAVAVPMVTGGDLKGVLLAGYGIDETLAAYLRRLTHSHVVFLSYPAGQSALLVASSLGPRDEALRGELARPELGAVQAAAEAQPFELALAGDRHLAVVAPLRSAAGDTEGAVVFLRSVSEEMEGFAQFRNSLVLVSLVVMLAALGLAYLGARRITGPVRTLVTLVERARDGSFSGAVAVASSDEIGVLARAFNNLLADLREKEQMISFLREGMTELRKGAAAGSGMTQAGADTTEPGDGATDVGSALTAAIAPVAPRVKLERGTRFASRYEIEGVLGKGGMGVVYRAADRTLDETVALKVLRPELVHDDPSLLSRFKQEIRLARKITHRNVLRTHDFGEADGIPYISMEYIEGVTLKDLIVNKGALPEGVGLRIAKQMCYGLDAAHRQAVVHRDIKPHNMMILPETGELKIMDFGIARLSEVKAEAGLTSDGMVVGTPDYMSPEQAQGRPADFRSDIYSLGVVLFEVFTGRLPFRGDTPMATVLHHIQTAPPAPRSVNPRIHESLERIILRCLAKNPDVRYPNLAEMIQDLSAASAKAEPAA